MKTILLMALCLFPIYSQTHVQTVAKAFSGTNTCNPTITSTGANHLLTMSVFLENGTTISSVSGGGTWQHVSAADGNDATGLGHTEIWFVPASSAGVTVVTVTASATSNRSCWVAEWSSAFTTWDVDVSGHTDNGTSCTTACLGPSLTVGTTTDVCLAVWDPAGSSTPDVNAPFNYDQRDNGGLQAYDLPGATGALQVSFTATGTTTSYNVSAVYFKQAVAAAPSAKRQPVIFK